MLNDTPLVDYLFLENGTALGGGRSCFFIWKHGNGAEKVSPFGCLEASAKMRTSE